MHGHLDKTRFQSSHVWWWAHHWIPRDIISKSLHSGNVLSLQSHNVPHGHGDFSHHPIPLVFVSNGCGGHHRECEGLLESHNASPGLGHKSRRNPAPSPRRHSKHVVSGLSDEATWCRKGETDWIPGCVVVQIERVVDSATFHVRIRWRPICNKAVTGM